MNGPERSASTSNTVGGTGARSGAIPLVLGLATLALAFPATAPAQDAGPLLKSDLVRMMTASNYTPTEMAAIVRMNCVGFEPTARDRNQLGNLPNAAVVLAEVERCRSRARTANRASSGDTEAEPAETEVERAPPRPRNRSIDLGELDIEASAPIVPELRRPETPEGLAAGATPARTSEPEFDTPPRLLNWKDVSAAFLREYRPNVRQPGTVLLWLRVGPDGRVAESRVRRQTGDPVMADAALRTTRVMEFEPATRRDRPVESWTELPINFSAK